MCCSPGAPSPIPTLPPLSSDILLFHDASFDVTSHHAGGGIVIFDCVHQRVHLIPVPIPVFVDSSFQAEAYTAWQALRAVAADPLLAFTFALRDPPYHFTDSLSLITSLENRKPNLHDPLTEALISACRSLQFRLRSGSPTHLPSHRSRDFRDYLLGQADSLANMTRLAHPPSHAWLSELQDAPVTLARLSIPFHNPSAILRRDLLCWFQQHTRGLAHCPDPTIWRSYATFAAHRCHPLEDHAQLFAIRAGCWRPTSPLCPLSGLCPHPYHPVWICPHNFLYLSLHHRHLFQCLEHLPLYRGRVYATPWGLFID